MAAAQSQNSTIDSGTRWLVRTSPQCEVTGAVVRLSDVANLVGSHAAWDRIKNTPIAMIPSGTGGVTIGRDRLADVISRSPAVPNHIDVVGTKNIVVRRRSPASQTTDVTGALPTDEVFAPDSTSDTFPDQNSPHPSDSHRLIQTVGYDSRSAFEQSVPAVLTGSDRESIRRRILTAIDRFHPDLDETTDISLSDNATLAVELRTGSVVDIQPSDPSQLTTTSSGEIQWDVSLRSGSMVQTIPVRLTLAPHPTMPAFRSSLPRGTVVREHHLTTVAVPADKLSGIHAVSAEQIIGKQTRSNVRPGLPIDPQDLRAPVLVSRGELIEVRVVGGGITVTSNAKSMEDGSQSQLIEIETVPNRKRLVARVVSVGMVEVITRSPVLK